MDLQQNNHPQTQAASFPYVYGSLAFVIGKKTAQSLNTHKWLVYVRGANNEDLSYLIKKVVFHLHTSFEKPTRQILQPPYQIQELGWGEFELMIEIHLNHPDMPTIQLPHMLRLHHSHQGGGQISKKPLCSQVYDQIVFLQMDQHLRKILQKKKQYQQKSIPIEQPQEQNDFALADQPLKSINSYGRLTNSFDPQDHKNKLQQALRFIKGQISGLEDRMRTADIDIQKVYEELYGRMG